MGAGGIGPGIGAHRRDRDLHIIIVGHGRTGVGCHRFNGAAAIRSRGVGPGEARGRGNRGQAVAGKRHGDRAARRRRPHRAKEVHPGLVLGVIEVGDLNESQAVARDRDRARFIAERDCHQDQIVWRRGPGGRKVTLTLLT